MPIPALASAGIGLILKGSMRKKLFIAVSGTMGVGKTTVAKILQQQLKFKLLKENFADNKFLGRFYNNLPRWAFHSQVFFLVEKIRQTQQVKGLLNDQSVIQDTVINEDVFSYAKAQLINKNMGEEEYNLYTKIYNTFKDYLVKPDLHIYLKADLDTLMKRISQRSREEEENVPRAYVKLLDGLNKQWIGEVPDEKKLFIETVGNNFVNDSKAVEFLVKEVRKKINKIEKN